MAKHPVADTRKVQVTFWDNKTQALIIRTVKAATSLGAAVVAIRHACQDMARDIGSPGWAQPGTLDGTGPWLVFDLMPGSRLASFDRHVPSREAAEMRLLHRYGGH